MVAHAYRLYMRHLSDWLVRVKWAGAREWVVSSLHCCACIMSQAVWGAICEGPYSMAIHRPGWIGDNSNRSVCAQRHLNEIVSKVMVGRMPPHCSSVCSMLWICKTFGKHRTGSAHAHSHAIRHLCVGEAITMTSSAECTAGSATLMVYS